MSFSTEPKPNYGVAEQVAPGINRIVANNPSMMTYHGTNTYVIEAEDGVYVLDPGPASDQAHLQSITDHLRGRAAGIILSHHHSDHFGLTPQLREALGVPVYAFEIPADDAFTPDVALKDGDEVAGMDALHTPGHASDHICLARSDGVLFTGDHVMSWNSSIVAPPDGNMASYVQQLRRLLERDDNLYLPGHGPPLPDPLPHTRQLLNHRERRERAILNALAEGSETAERLANRLYRKSHPHLAWAAQRNLEAHLEKLSHEGVVRQNGTGKWMLTDGA
jgi:glyoxylase-like metal-dependent hydrolase (beta-lactamase superfamily II)